MTTPNTATTNILNIRTWGDVRSLIHNAAPVIATAFAAAGWATDEHALLWGALVAVIAAPALATANTARGFRRWLYPVLGAVAALAVAYGLIAQGDVQIWVPVIVAVFGGTGSAIAGANTNTSPATERPKTSAGRGRPRKDA